MACHYLKCRDISAILNDVIWSTKWHATVARHRNLGDKMSNFFSWHPVCKRKSAAKVLNYSRAHTGTPMQHNTILYNSSTYNWNVRHNDMRNAFHGICILNKIFIAVGRYVFSNLKVRATNVRINQGYFTRLSTFYYARTLSRDISYTLMLLDFKFRKIWAEAWFVVENTVLNVVTMIFVISIGARYQVRTVGHLCYRTRWHKDTTIMYYIHSDLGKSIILWLMCMEITERLYKSEVIPRDFP